MSKIIKKLYFFTKLSSSIILLLIILLFIFLFSRAYLKQEKLPKNNFSEELGQINEEINLKLNQNNNSISKILESIEKIENEINIIKNSNKIDNNINLKNEIDKISDDIVDLKKLSQNKLNNSKKNILIDERKFLIDKYIDSIVLSIEHGNEFKDTINELQTLIENKSFKEDLEKLLLFSDGSMLSYLELKNSFDKKTNIFIKEYIISKNNNSFYIKFFLKFFNLRPDIKSVAEDPIINKLSITKNYLEEKKIAQAINELETIRNIGNIYKKWIENAKNYDDSINIINLIKENKENL
tara:strand:+ start:2536 stop:3426 length:891 start_codon:yes stop_codon:yes gene_type:complete